MMHRKRPDAHPGDVNGSWGADRQPLVARDPEHVECAPGGDYRCLGCKDLGQRADMIDMLVCQQHGVDLVEPAIPLASACLMVLMPIPQSRRTR